MPSPTKLTLAAAIALAGMTAPALAKDFSEQNATCVDALRDGLPAGLSETSISFDKRRGAGKKQRLFYSLSHDAGRGKATCILYRGEVQELQFDKKFNLAIAAAR